MKKTLLVAALALASCLGLKAQTEYVPTEANLKSREEFRDMKLGIFLHWGLYSMFAQGEWYLQNAVPDRYEYAKVADAFYPHRFDARQWVRSIKEAGAKYICFTTRHHDGFSMWATKQSKFNIVEATPFGRDVLKELAQACKEEGIRLHLYYSHIDWMRDDYPMGRTGTNCGKTLATADWDNYYKFMNAQLTELLTEYGEVGSIWFDGWWDHEEDTVPFDWQLPGQYEMIHRLQPACLVGNNHHGAPQEGEDIQIFERDLPGEMTSGFAKHAAKVSRLPLETCQTMNGMWGYKVIDTNYKTADDIIRLLINTSGKGANLLMNIGPQPNGELPAVALDRLKSLGEWTSVYGETIYGTDAGDIKPQKWGVSTQKDGKLYLHITALNEIEMNENGERILHLPLERKVKSVTEFVGGAKVNFKKTKECITITLPGKVDVVDYVLVLQ